MAFAGCKCIQPILQLTLYFCLGVAHSWPLLVSAVCQLHATFTGAVCMLYCARVPLSVVLMWVQGCVTVGWNFGDFSHSGSQGTESHRQLCSDTGHREQSGAIHILAFDQPNVRCCVSSGLAVLLLSSVLGCLLASLGVCQASGDQHSMQG